MKLRTWVVVIVVALAMLTAIDAHAQRTTAFISDVHLGLGRTPGGDWHPYEDFRWSSALKGFLDAISSEGNDRVDLVIVGDFLELWQLPDDIQCRGTGPDAGCSVPELVDLASRIVRAHRADLDAFKAFANRGQNKLHVIPGNHDAALLIPEVWRPVAVALGESTGRVTLVTSGVWRSADRRVLAEHGHQIGSDVNRFADWPTVTVEQSGQRLMIRPWGERFVQEIFNREEARYPVIDNLSPESAGARYRMADRGVWGTAADLARFVAFNIFETSLGQKTSALGPPSTEPAYDRATAIGLRHNLFARSLPANDPFRKALEDNTDPASARLRDALAALAATMSDDELHMLCKNIVTREKTNPCTPVLSALVAGALIPRTTVIKAHLAERRHSYGEFDVFVYAHTHTRERGWKVPMDNAPPVTVLNTGAFQRLVDEDGFLRRARDRGWSEAEALRRLRPEDLAACYGVVVIKPPASGAAAELRSWHMPEGGTGRFRDPDVSDCE